MKKKLDSVDTNSQHVLKLQFGAIRKVQMNVMSLDKIISEEAEKKRHENMEDDDVDSPENHAIQIKHDEQQKMSLLNAANAQYSNQQLTLENI